MSIRNRLRVWWARLLGYEAIALLDYHGKVLYSRVEQQAADGPLEAWVYPLNRIGAILLLDDGTVTGPEGQIHYIDHWLYLDERLRTEQILRGARGFDLAGSRYRRD
jgi:hypothetical protein